MGVNTVRTRIVKQTCVCVCVFRPEVSDAVENVDMSLEELQLLLRTHQHSVEPGTAVIDVSTHSHRHIHTPIPVRAWYTHTRLGDRTWSMCFSLSPSTCL